VNALLENCDLVVHFAAESHVDRSIKDPDKFIKTNIQGSHNLLEGSLRNGVKKYIQISTDEVYGSIESGSWDENCPLMPNSPYSASKASADLIALSYFKTFNLNVSITRCSNNYGNFQNIEKAIPHFITNLINNSNIPIYGNGKNIRDWIHVTDHCLGIIKVIESGKPGEIYNFGGGSEISNIALAKKILDIFDEPESRINYVEDRKGHDFRYSVDPSKAKNTLDWSPSINFDDGLRSTVEWYKNNQNWWKK
jgi:dTDP-glucose 4,6-dehydratase